MSAQTSSIVTRSLEDLAQPHIESFDYFIQDGMRNLVENMRPVEVRETPHTSMLLAGNLVDHLLLFLHDAGSGSEEWRHHTILDQ